ncbi:MAG: type I-D CRISPR-associated helicase Cas3' [Planctomycetia bacterium]|nr:type I-D CRISPR-associated helicase Cas3' [Planctomycetia bacterium]
MIDDMEKEYAKAFPSLQISKLNRKKLDDLNAKGPDRWNALIQVITDNEIIITNPDLLNFALFGGYYRHKGQKEISEIFARIDYFVFDEYHLYDEEQIANIISWIAVKKALIAKPVKFIFASATPEKGLLEILRTQGFNPADIIEFISDKATSSSRKIHGQIEVTFLKGATPLQYLISNAETIKQWIKDGERILVVFDRMTELRMAKPEIEKQFHDVVIAEVSVYYTKSEIKEAPGNAGLILGTNKIEVGVNLDVSICLMQTGKYFANFIQRFGRIARQGKDGKAIIFLDNKIKEIEKAFTGKETLSYYDFIEQCRNIELLSDRKFYSEKIPQYLGAYYFIIATNIKDYATQKLFRETVNIDGQAGFMLGLMRKIDKGIRRLEYINSACGKKFNIDIENWKEWWKIFTGTFKYFRASMPDILVRDLTCNKDNQITRYSLEWILENREIVREESINGERCLVVSGFLEGKQELQYYVESLPVYKLNEGNLYLQQKEKYSLKEAFEKRLVEIAKMYKGQNQFVLAARQLIGEVEKLKPIVTHKRLFVSDVQCYSNFL